MHQATKKSREASAHSFTTSPSINSRLLEASHSSNPTPSSAMSREAEDNFITEMWRQVLVVYSDS